MIVLSRILLLDISIHVKCLQNFCSVLLQWHVSEVCTCLDFNEGSLLNFLNIIMNNFVVAKF